MLRRAAHRNYIEVYWPINFKENTRAHEPLTAGQINHLLLFPTQPEQRPAPEFIIARRYLHKTP